MGQLVSYAKINFGWRKKISIIATKQNKTTRKNNQLSFKNVLFIALWGYKFCKVDMYSCEILFTRLLFQFITLSITFQRF